jgi:hypothetical protein
MGLRGRRPLFTGAGGAALAAGVSWLLDPHSGAGRRAALRLRAVRVLSRTRARFAPREVLSDELVADRVRARLVQLGVAARFGGSVEVSSTDRRVALRGAVSAAAHERIVRQVARVAGVREVVDQLELASELVAPAAAPPTSPWAPPMRAFAAAAGIAAVTWAGVARTRLAFASAALGLGLVARSAANRPLRELLRPDF